MDCYQHCVERYGISLSDKNGKSAKAVIVKKWYSTIPLFGKSGSPLKLLMLNELETAKFQSILKISTYWMEI